MDLKLVFALVLMALVCQTMAYELEEEQAEKELRTRALEGILKQLQNLKSRSQEHEKKDIDPECYVHSAGYRGTVSTTKSGKTCQRWTSTTPHSHNKNPTHYPHSDVGNHNYCRNPDGERTAWCYTTDSRTRWEYCNIGPQQDTCIENVGYAGIIEDGCYTKTDGRDYRGTVSTTVTGRTCQKWTSQTPHGHGKTPANTPDSIIGKAIGDHNYCRNPDGMDTVWCYTTDSDRRWEYCDIGNQQGQCSSSDGGTVTYGGLYQGAWGRK